MDAIVLAGGRSRRFGADKATFELAGERLTDRVIRAARRAGARQVVLAGPAGVGALADTVVRERPPFAGPLAALAAALPAVTGDEVLVLACDLESPDQVCRVLLAEAAQRPDGVVLVDEEGRTQWLAARYRVASTVAAIERLSEVRDQPLRRALAGLDVEHRPAGPGVAQDIDTPEDALRAQRRSAAETQTRTFDRNED